MPTQRFCCQDPANRLSAANEPAAAPGLTGWTQNYNYDAFGNRAVAAGSYMPNEGFTPSGTVASVFPASNNRLVRGLGDGSPQHVGELVADFHESDHRFHLKSIIDFSLGDHHRSEATLACLILQ